MVKNQIIQNYRKVNDVFLEIFENQLMYNNSFWLQVRNNDLLAYNVFNGNRYTLLNQIILNYQCNLNRFLFNRWLTLKQAAKLGVTLKDKNQKASFIINQATRFHNKEDNTDITGMVKYKKRNKTNKSCYQYNIVNKLYVCDIYNISQFNGFVDIFFTPGLTEKMDEKIQELIIRDFIFHSGPIVHESSNFNYQNYDDHLLVKPRYNFANSHEYCKHIIYRLAEWAKLKVLNKNYKIYGLEYGIHDAMVNELFSILIYSHFNIEPPIIQDPGFMTQWIKAVLTSDQLVIKSIAYARKLFDFVRYSNIGRMRCSTLRLANN